MAEAWQEQVLSVNQHDRKNRFTVPQALWELESWFEV